MSNADIRLLCEEDFTAAIQREKKTKRCRLDSRGSKRIALAKLQNARRSMVQVRQAETLSIEKI